MSVASLPFEVQKSHAHSGGVKSCPMFRLLPEPLQKEAEANAFLLDYIHLLPVEEYGVPDFYTELDRKMGDMKDPNLIYAIGGGLYIHIFPNPNDARDHYIAIEPGMVENNIALMEELEDHLVDKVDMLDDEDGDLEKRKKVLLTILKDTCTVVKPKALKLARVKAAKKAGSKMPVTKTQYGALRYRLIRDKEGMGVIEPLIQDPYLEDISCSGVGPIFLEHKIFGGLTASINFRTTEELDTFVIQMSEKIGRPVTFREPIIDATLPDGSRINLVFGVDVSRRGAISPFVNSPLTR